MMFRWPTMARPHWKPPSTYRPDVVLLDIGLPGLDGFEVAKRLRQQPGLSSVVLVAMTGYGQESDRQRSQEAGFDHHLVKPADFGTAATNLGDRLGKGDLMLTKRGMTCVSALPKPWTVKVRKPMPTTEKTLRVLIVDDNRDGADALGLLVEELGNQVHVTYGGTQALDVATAFRADLMLVDLVNAWIWMVVAW